MAEKYADRHPDVQNLMRWLKPNPRLPEDQKAIVESLYMWAQGMVLMVPDGPELTEGLRKLLEAKDCFVRASLPPEDDRG